MAEHDEPNAPTVTPEKNFCTPKKAAIVTFDRSIAILGLLAGMAATWFAFHADSEDTKARSLKPNLSVVFANGTAEIELPGTFYNGLKAMEIAGDLHIRNTGTKPATNVVVNIVAPSGLASPLPMMPLKKGPTRQLIFIQSQGTETRAEVSEPTVILQTDYDIGTFNFTAEPNTYRLYYRTSCSECDNALDGDLTLKVVKPRPRQRP